MKKSLFANLSGITLMLIFSMTAQAGPDQYVGDSAIYSGAAASVKPNVLFVIDNSAGMRQSGVSGEYKPETTYPGTYSPNAVYVRQAATKGTINYNLYLNSIDSVTCASAKTQLIGPGAYYGKLKKSDGSCDASQSGNYYLGNFLNYLTQPAAVTPEWVSGKSYSQGDAVQDSGVSYLCSQGGTTGASKPAWPTTYDASVTDGTVIWILNPSSIIDMVESTVGQVTASVRDTINVGLMVFGDNNSGGKILRPVSDISTASGQTAYDHLIASINGISNSLLSGNHQPVNEALWDAGLYYRGQNSSTLKISSERTTYPSPFDYTCQKSFIIFLSTGNTPDINHTKNLLTDLNNNGTVGDAADAAIYNFIRDNQSVQTTIIQLMSVEVPILKEAAAGGGGEYYNVWDTTKLTEALHDTIVNIVKEVDTSFVAPVVPVSPENRTYSGSRVYMGFFKPISERYWNGNLKKYGINSANNITDKNGVIANFVDLNGDRIDDILLTSLPDDAVNGTFKDTAQSFWSTVVDKGAVEKGGAGGLLLARNLAVVPRNIFTYTGTNTNLTNAANAFSTANATYINNASLGLGSDDDKNKLINFIHGFDAYDEDSNGNTTEKRGKNADGESPLENGWIMGDILHSKPLIVNYSAFAFTGTNENNCDVNDSIIYVGANDGMLHAFRDCDGSEAWGFIPPDLLGNLQHMTANSHNYFVDSSPSVYIFDKNNNGNIETGAPNNDKVILVFGQRRGGGSDTAPTKGSYYALDVSNPASPVFLWSISNSKVQKGTTTTSTTDFEELAETWSEPKIVKMKIGGADKIVAFVGAGYDNANEDSRYGATQTFTGTGTVNNSDLGKGNVTSTGANSPLIVSDKGGGRGIYAIEIATIISGVPDFTNSGNKIRGFTHAGNSAMNFSFPGEISALDMNNNSYADRLYAGDTGGNIWRFDVGSTDPSAWTGRKIFSSNPVSGDATDKGRKIFYKPSVVIESATTTMLYFGTGDREHPLNWAVTDRFYALKDKGQETVKVESDLLDVTLDLLQTSNDPDVIAGILNTLNLPANFGWYIKLNEHTGEKVLAPPTVFNKVAYFTTYAPNTAVVPDPCDPGNLGTARLYAVDYKTGEAVLNYDRSNDNPADITNKRALTTPGQVLLRSDRVKTLGSGIPSGIVMIISPSGELKTLIGVGGIIPGENPKKGGSIIPLYWRQK
jgi:type IV pilus assembly protein PilY1